MNHNLGGEYGKVLLGPLDDEDCEKLRVLRNRDDKRFCFFFSDIIEPEAQRDWYERYLTQTDDFTFSVFSKKTGEWIGAAALYNVDRENGAAEFGRLLIDNAKRSERGLGKSTVYGVCAIGFSQLGLNTIFLEVYEKNMAARAVYDFVGFQVVCKSERNGESTLRMQLLNNELNLSLLAD